MKPTRTATRPRSTRPRSTRSRTDALGIIDKLFFKGRPEMLALLEEERAGAEIARTVHALRAKAGLTQAQLARRVGTTASVISRLEDADYDGHSLAMLRRIAAAMGMVVELRFVAAGRGRAA
jgi:ribosome-binding protein aMBF1 (putative translation factor)